jgi:hypothetical protein
MNNNNIYLFFPYILYFSSVFNTGERFRQKAKSKIQKRSELGGFLVARSK